MEECGHGGSGSFAPAKREPVDRNILLNPEFERILVSQLGADLSKLPAERPANVGANPQ